MSRVRAWFRGLGRRCGLWWHDGKLDHLVLADSVLILDPNGADPMAVTDDPQAVTTRELRKGMDALPTGSAEHTAALRSFIERLADYRNRPGGFWGASTDPPAAEEAAARMPLRTSRRSRCSAMAQVGWSTTSGS